MADRWLVFVILAFVSGAIGFIWGYVAKATLFIYVGGFWFSLGVFAATRWGYDRWKGKQKQKKRR
ncbi:MAG TPA: hypothetical protein VI698_00595 [Nitrososphaerales archaeon]|nr:hypothetical protein [Nitrososphaerales archaeon]